jgi:pyruvate dehydrogenase E1 component alpha subunit
MEVLDVYEKTREAVARARAGAGPTLIECKTYRYMGHSRFEPSSYRSKEEVETWKQKDPIPRFAEYLQGRCGIAPEVLQQIDREVEQEIEEAVLFAEESPDPDLLDYQDYIYA